MNRKYLSLMLAAMLAIFLLPALFTLLGQSRVAQAAEFTVNTTDDELSADCVSSCSIRTAIAVSDGGDTIFIPAGVYTLTMGQLSVTKTLIFSGTGGSPADVMLVAGENNRLFSVSSGTATFFNLTLQDGSPATDPGGAINATGSASLILDTAVITNNQTSSTGGGIAIGSGSLTVTNSQIMSNTATNSGGGIYSNNGPITLNNSQILTNTTASNGGGVSLNQPNASLVMNSGQINGNISTNILPSAFPGGGVHILQGTFTLNGGEIRNNQAIRGGGVLISAASEGSVGSATINGGQVIDNEASYGGGVYVRGSLLSSAVLTINGGEVTQNESTSSSSFGGGGIYIFQGTAVMNGGSISANTAANFGGALEIAEGSFTLNGGEIFNNSAANMGGAIYNDRGTLMVKGGTIHSNSSSADGGGGIYNDANGHVTIANSAILTNTAVAPATGGGMLNTGTLTMTNVTMSGNEAASGGGLANSGTAVLTNVTISENSSGVSHSGSGSLTVGNSIIYGNSGSDCSGDLNSAGNNITECGVGIDSDPLLQPLALNDGSTLNYALGLNSPAIDAGSNDLCPATDQRGNLRPVGELCDIGAYEDGIGFFINDASLIEGDAGSSDMIFTVIRSFTTTETYSVDYETMDVGGTAVAEVDYEAVFDTLTFLPTDQTKTIVVAILGDTLDEEDETFTVVLSNPTNGSRLGNSSGTGIILDDDDPPSLTLSGDIMIEEGDSGTVTAVFTATLSSPSSKTITVDYATVDGTAIAGEDYLTASGIITFAPGAISQTISIDIVPDTIDEFDETFTVELSNPDNVTLADSSAQVTILDNDDPPTLTIADASVTEGNSGTTNMVFTVSLSEFSSKLISVTYSTEAGSATAGVDYVITSGTLNIAPGDETQTITVPVIGDTIDEFDETFLVKLGTPINATIETPGETDQATGTILDDDPLPVATIGNATVTEGDSGTVTAVFTVTLSAASEKTITINYSSADGSAVAGEDYTAVSGTLAFSPGGPLSQPINVLVNGDTKAEQTEQFFINLTGSSNVTLGNSQGVGTILDDDGVFIFLPFVIKP